MDTIGVIGAGQMGAGIAQVAAHAGYRVLLADVSRDVADRGRAQIGKALDRLVTKDKIARADADAALALIEPVDGVAAMNAGAGLVIEAATEREEIKRRIFAEVGAVLGADAILATNTSSIPITRLAQAAPDAARFVGVHFFNPVPVMGLIELIRGLATSDATVAAVKAFAVRLGKQVVHANDAPGFIVNRVLMPMLNEACFALGEGVAGIRDIDLACQLGLEPPDGTADAGRLHRARHLPGDHPRAVRGDGRSEVSACPAAGQICRSRMGRAKGETGFLRLFGRGTGADAVGVGTDGGQGLVAGPCLATLGHASRIRMQTETDLETSLLGPVLADRSCGDCTVCCTVLKVDTPDFRKPAGLSCIHLTSRGCGIHAVRPSICRTWFCAWRRVARMPDAARPDRSGLLVSLNFVTVPRNCFEGVSINVRALGNSDAIPRDMVAAVLDSLCDQLVAVWFSDGSSKMLMHPEDDVARLVISGDPAPAHLADEVAAWRRRYRVFASGG